MSLQNLGDGANGSILWRHGYLGNSTNCLAALFLVSLEWFCLAADLLIFIFLLHPLSSWDSGLVSPLAAFLSLHLLFGSL